MNYIFVLFLFSIIRIIFTPITIMKTFMRTGGSSLFIILLLFLQYYYIMFVFKMIVKYSLYAILAIMMIGIIKTLINKKNREEVEKENVL